MANDATAVVVGRLIRDPSHTVGKSGQTIVNFTIGVNTTMKNEKDEFESNFYNVSVFGRTGEYLLDRIQKGTLVQVTGDLLLQTYQDKTTGESKRSLNIQASKVRPLAFTKDAPRRSTTSEQASIDPEPDNRPF